MWTKFFKSFTCWILFFSFLFFSYENEFSCLSRANFPLTLFTVCIVCGLEFKLDPEYTFYTYTSSLKRKRITKFQFLILSFASDWIFQLTNGIEGSTWNLIHIPFHFVMSHPFLLSETASYCPRNLDNSGLSLSDRSLVFIFISSRFHLWIYVSFVGFCCS